MTFTNLKPNTRAKITLAHHEFEGLVLPQEGDFIVLKLSSGYNIGINPKHIKDVKELGDIENAPVSPEAKEQNKELPSVHIIHTGGTIASKVDYKTGGVIADFTPEALLELFPELSDLAFVKSDFLGNMFSDDFRFSHFNKMAQAIQKAAQEGTTRFIVTSGTDNLHYLSAALSFMFRNHPISIMVVGSQRSSDRGSSDAAMNLICATQFLVTTDFVGVGICMHENTDDDTGIILPGINARKMHSSRRDAFKPINTTAYARVKFAEKTVELLRDLPKKQQKKLPETVELFDEDLKIGLCYAHPQMYAEELLAYKNFDGLVLAGSGLGHFPMTEVDSSCKEHTKIADAIQTLVQKMPLAMSTQTIYGRVHMNVYAPARKIKTLGVLGHLSGMTPETTYIKLAWLLSTQKDNLVALFEDDLVGEHQSINENAFY